MTKKVLIAEDEEDLRNLVKIYLEPYDIEVLEASDGEEAVVVAKEKKPDMIITDNNMPFLTGYELLQKLKSIQETRNIPVVMVTGRKFDQEMQMLIKFDAKDFIQKPYEEEKIVAVVKKVLGDINKKGLEQSSMQESINTETISKESKDVIEKTKPDQENKVVELETENFVPEPKGQDQIQSEKNFFVSSNNEQFVANTEQSVIDNSLIKNEPVVVTDDFNVIPEELSVLEEIIPKIHDNQPSETTNEIFYEKRDEDKMSVIEQQDIVEQNIQEKNILDDNSVEEVITNKETENISSSVETSLLPPDFTMFLDTKNEDKMQNITGESIEQSNLKKTSEPQGLDKQEQKIEKPVDYPTIEKNTDIGNQQVIIEELSIQEEKIVPELKNENLVEDISHHDKEIENVVQEQKEAEQKQINTEFVQEIKETEIRDDEIQPDKEKIVSTDENLHVTDEGLYLASKLVSKSVIEVLFPNKNIKITPESKAIILILENKVNKDILLKLDHIIEKVPLMKLFVNEQVFNEKKGKINNLIKKVSKEEIMQLYDTLTKFFKR